MPQRITTILGGVFAALLLLAAISVVMTRGLNMPPGIAHNGQPYEFDQARLLFDTTYMDAASGERRSDQMIFDAMLEMVGQARELIVLDMFLFNHFHGQEQGWTRDVTTELTTALVKASRHQPTPQIILITDPINTVYGGLHAPHLEQLAQAGVDVVITGLTALRDSNPSYSGLWRLLGRPLGNAADEGWLPNALGEGKVTLRSYLSLLNFKANHRKTLVADNGAGSLQALVTSANPHTASSAHSNIGIVFDGPAAVDLLHTEQAVLAFSSDTVRIPERWLRQTSGAAAENRGASIRVVTEQAIEQAVIAALQAAGPGDEVRLAMFYLSDRTVVKALAAAQQRGAVVRALLDPNKDAFGRQKNGIPARPVAAELHAQGVEVRWCDTHGEQCHFKVLTVDERTTGRSTIILGSANFTRRNLDNYNLESDVVLSIPGDAKQAIAFRDWFDGLWTNGGGRAFSVDYAHYAEEGLLKRLQYRFMEHTGWSSF